MDRQTADHPFQYSIEDPPFEAVRISTKLAHKSALDLSLLYTILLFLIGVGLGGTWTLGNLGNPYAYDLNLHHLEGVVGQIAMIYGFGAVVGIAGFIVGILPALMVGWFSGVVIGNIFDRWIPTPLPTRSALFIGFGISALLLAGRLLVARWLFGQILALDLFMSAVIWYAPNALAFVGLWWVVYRVNEQMKLPTTMPPLSDN